MGKEIIWEIRNSKKFEDTNLSNHETVYLIISRVKERITLDKSLLSVQSFEKIWLKQPSGLILKGDGKIQFHIILT